MKKFGWLGKFDVGSQDVDPDSEYARIFIEHKELLATKWKNYFSIYDSVFLKHSNGFVENGSERPVKFLEIGVDRGGSLQIWRKYFGPNATIFGVDINPECANLDNENFQVRIGSQADKCFLQQVVKEMGGVDLVVDDGSHKAKHLRKTFDIIFPLLSEGGVYLIEDVHASYHFMYGGGFRRSGSIVQVMKSMVDGLNKDFFKRPIARRVRLAHSEIHSIKFFESIIVIEKLTREKNFIIRSGSLK